MIDHSTATDWRIDSETGVLCEVLMCRPEHFSWLPTCETALDSLNKALPFDRQKALQQHHELAGAISGAGVIIHWLDSDESLPDLCWTRDSSHMTPWGALITRLSEPVRAGEHQRVEKFYTGAGHAIWRHIDAGNVEGGDIHFVSPGLAVFGYSGARTRRKGVEQLAAWVRKAGWEVRLQPVDQKFVHLDVLFCMAGDGLAVVCEEALGSEFITWLGSHGIRSIDISVSDALRLCCNLLSLGNERVIVPSHCKSVARQLRAEGLEVTQVELDMFTLGGGGVHCLTQPLSRGSTR